MSYEADEQRRSWKLCACPIYASGTLAGRFKRKNTERTTWDEAKPLVRAWERAGSWDSPATLEAPSPLVPVPVWLRPCRGASQLSAPSAHSNHLKPWQKA
jgi:hypothetical protein